MTGLGFLPGGTSSTANGVNADGSVVVGSSNAPGISQEAFRWTGGVMTGLGFLPGGTSSTANGVNADGSVVVGSSNAPGISQEAFRWTGGVMTGLGFLPGGTSSTANGVNADGSVVVGSSNAPGISQEAFRWTGGVMTGLGFLPGGNQSVAQGVNADGSVVVGQSNSSSGLEAFRWTPIDHMQSIQALLIAGGVNMTGWQLSGANSVSATGITIVGFGQDPSNQTEAWIARFGPEGAGFSTPTALQTSVNNLADEHAGVMAQEFGLALPLLGDDKPLDNNSEIGVFGYGGSEAGGGFARYGFNYGLTLLAGVSYGQEAYDHASLDNSFLGAVALRYLEPGRGLWHPLVEVGGWIAPEASLEFDRTYMNGSGTATGVGNTHGDLSYYFGRAGVALNLAPREQIIVSGEIGRERLSVDGYSETLEGNPFDATVAPGTDSMDIAKARLAYSFGITRAFDATLWGAAVYGFDNQSDLIANVDGVGSFTAVTDQNLVWAEYGARVGYALTTAMTFDVFAEGVSGEKNEIGTRVHGGAGLRYRF